MSDGARPAPRSDRLNSVSALVGELSELSSLVLATDALDRVVWEAAMLAVRSVGGVSGCGVTVTRDGSFLSIMPEVAPFGRLENFQYEHDAGPVLQAIRERRTVLVGSETAAQWPAYAELAQELGVGASLVVPLTVGDSVLGAMSLYADDTDVLSADRGFAELVADLTSTALSCMARQADQVKLGDELRTALESRAVIEQAKGMLMARGHTADEAFAVLRRISQNRNTKLREIAAVAVELGGPPSG